LSTDAEEGEFRMKGKVERKGKKSSRLIGGREKEAAGSTDQAVEQVKHKL